ncbi:MAG: hypothetical protein LBN39_09905 [Planctomycetaceae bacterium]|jgi:DNA repair exonuclease SbcCD ATPase subunit|nr:hypothetical protein [Planctomycetaceae bacterium]
MSVTVPQPLTFEQMMEVFRQLTEQTKETDRQFKETDERLAKERKEADERLARERKETDERLAEERKEIDARLAKERKEIDARLAKSEEKLNKKIAALGDRIGELIEVIVEGGIVRKFQGLGYDFTTCARHYEFKNKALGFAGEIDLFLENGDYVLAVEIKANLSIDDVKEHLERMDKFRRFLDGKNDKRKIIAAIGGGVIRENIQAFALKKGLFVIIQTGETINVLQPSGGEPHKW